VHRFFSPSYLSIDLVLDVPDVAVEEVGDLLDGRAER
jgi:hypothetical protein